MGVPRFCHDDDNFFTDWAQSYEDFQEMDLPPDLLRGLREGLGFEHPTPIQKKGIVPFLRRLDTIQKAGSCCGKTTALCAGVLGNLLDRSSSSSSSSASSDNDEGVQALVIAPGRAQAVACHGIMHAMGEAHLGRVRCHASYGELSIREDTACLLNGGIRVVVATPERAYDLIRRGALSVNSLKMFVLDDVSDLLSWGFKDQACEIFNMLPPGLQVGMFSSEVTREVMEMANAFMVRPVRVLLYPPHVWSLDNVAHFYLDCQQQQHKGAVLRDTVRTFLPTAGIAIVYVNTCQQVDEVADDLRERHLTAAAVHMGMDSQARDRAMREWRGGSCRILVLTFDMASCGQWQDVAAKSSCTFVINYQPPFELEDYLESAGRTRRNRRRIVINLVAGRDEVHVLEDLQHFYDTAINELPPDAAGVRL